MPTATNARSTAHAHTKPVSAHAEPKPMSAVIVFGLDKDSKPIAAAFPNDQAGLATKAAKLMNLRTLTVAGPELTEVARLLPAGRIYASGHGFVPGVEARLYEVLSDIANRKAPPGLPASWDDIDVGHLVIARDEPNYGWWEGIVIARDGDMLTVRWRDYPKQAPAVLHRAALALLKPTAA